MAGETYNSIVGGEGLRLIFVASIEGYDRLLTTGLAGDAESAWSAHADWGGKSAIGGVVIGWDRGQEIEPWSTKLSTPVLKIGIPPGEDDAFGKAVFASAAGTETKLGPNGITPIVTSVQVKRTVDFGASGEIHIGPECLAYSSKNDGTATFTISTRGKYAAFTVGDLTTRYSRAHDVPPYQAGVALPPVVCSQPRTWIGRHVAVWAHAVRGGAVDNRAEALRCFAGRIISFSDSENGWTWLEVEDLRGAMREAVILRNQFTANVKDGLYIPAGLRIDFEDDNAAGAALTADTLVCVASGAAGTNEFNAGVYQVEEFHAILNSWLQAEYAAGRLRMRWTFSLVDTDQGPRTQVQTTQSGTDGFDGTITVTHPMVLNLMGWDGDWLSKQFIGSGTTFTSLSGAAPYRRLIIDAPGSDWLVYIEAEQGALFDNSSWFPPELWGVAQDDSLAVFQVGNGPCFLGDTSGEDVITVRGNPTSARFLSELSGASFAEWYQEKYSVRLGEDYAPLTIRQVLVHRARFRTTVLRFLLSTGSGASFNGASDVLPEQCGAAIPFEVCQRLEADLNHLDEAHADLLVVVEKPTQLWDVLGVEFLMRGAQIVWKSDATYGGQYRVVTWSTPTAGSTLHSLTEDNKAIPSGQETKHRTVAREDDRWCKNVIKLEYNRTLKGSGEAYESSIRIVNTEAVQAVGERTVTLKARNTFSGLAGSGEAVETLVGSMQKWLPMFSKPVRRMRRTIHLPMFEGMAPGDHCTITDNFVRDPATGARRVTGRAALIVRHECDLGMFQDEDATEPSPHVGIVDVLIFPRQRVAPYSPCAQVDSAAASAGYNSATNTFTFKAHEHSETSSPVDVSNFASGDACVIVEMDPADPASPLTWSITLDVVNTGANTATHTGAALVGWDATKRYRMISANYATAVATQRTDVYQADDADGMIVDTAQPYEYGWRVEGTGTWTDDTATSQVDLYASLYAADGAPLDVGAERSLARIVNNLVNYRTAPSLPYVGQECVETRACERALLIMLPVNVGYQDLGAGDRKLYVSPTILSNGGSSVTLTVSLCRGLPYGSDRIISTGGASPEYVLVGPYESHTWTTSSTTLATGAAHGFSTKVLGSTGRGWLVFEGTQNCVTRGPAQVRCGPYGEEA